MNDKIKPALATYRFVRVHMCNGSVVIVKQIYSFKVKKFKYIPLVPNSAGLNGAVLH